MVAISLPIHSIVRMFELVVNCETWWKEGLLPNEHIVTGGIGDWTSNLQAKLLICAFIEINCNKIWALPKSSSTLPLAV